ncbi:glycoside hydrolase family 95 protein [Cohnella endophytica]|uniref:Glycoside hydrolase family 95 protein n=1 Tax=Cohnella endophytica TaxID=2419778 RepID=A0A494XPF6_9BACL|nr:glycoside hydrolase family 95 protein [Cohnella endophytica]RKP49944.1 glycoside hydrolase family 95 protein [Cohnella endophytica]
MTTSADKELKLRYGQPASSWIGGLPIGNGRLGAMIHGGCEEETLSLNEDTLWSGYPSKRHNDQAKRHLEPVRQLLFEGRYKEAQQSVEEHMLGTWQESYLPLADLKVSLDAPLHASGYRRELDLRTAIALSRYESSGGVRIERECFASHPDQVLVYRVVSSRPGALNVGLGLTSKLRCEVGTEGPYLFLKGESPSRVMPHYVPCDDPIRYGESEEQKGMAFGAVVKVMADGGELHRDEAGLRVTGANSVTLLLAASTGYNGYEFAPSRDGELCLDQCRGTIEDASYRSFEQLRLAHLEDYRSLFGRVELELGSGIQSSAPTDERLHKVKSGEREDPGLTALLYQYGRYLLIASSRPGTQPANLQGIWNDRIRPYWSSNWTTNINAQMNYWLAESANLAECHVPLLQLVEDISLTGRETARIHYDCGGWVAHHNVDLWRTTTPAAGLGEHWACCSFWPMGGVWLSQHLWEHYAFGLDESYLAGKAYPVMREAAIFCLDWLISSPEGYKVTAPSTSPENSYLNDAGERTTVSIASTADMSMIWELFANCIAASEILGADKEFRRTLREAQARLYPLRIGKHRQLREWFDDPEEFEVQHRHFSHLFALHPGTRICPERDPELAKAAETSLRRRVIGEAEQIGWSLAWLSAQYARLGMAREAHQAVSRFAVNSLYDSLLCSHAPLSPEEETVFQIDGNFGITAGINEMLLQSQHGIVHLLPALPEEWSEGMVTGLRVRGGAEVGMRWKNGRLQEYSIHSAVDGTVSVRYGSVIRDIQVQADQRQSYQANEFRMEESE